MSHMCEGGWQMHLRIRRALQGMRNEKGGIDTYIATTICLSILILFLTVAFYLANVVSKYNSMHRTMDMVVDDLKTYGGYTKVTHDSVRSFLERRGFNMDKVVIYATTPSGASLSASPLRYGESIHVVMEYTFTVTILGDTNLYKMRVGSTAISQFVDGAVPNQCYMDTSGGLNAAVQDPPCTMWNPPTNNNTPGGTDFLWQ